MLPKLITSIHILTGNNIIDKVGGDFVTKNSIMSMAKGVIGGMIAGVALGAAGKTMIDKSPKTRKKANKAMRTIGQIVDTAQYMFS